MFSRQEEPGEGRSATARCLLLWYASCVLTLGLAPGYYNKIQGAQIPNYSAGLNSRRLPLDEIKWDRQQERSRPIVLLATLGAASVSAPAIPPLFGSPNLHWTASAFYILSCGLSLEGLFLIFYLDVLIGSPFLELTGYIATEQPLLPAKTGPVAVITALPVAITIYSSLSFMAGLLAMTVVSGDASSPKDHVLLFRIVVWAPLLLIPVCAACAVVACAVSRDLSEVRIAEQRELQGRVDDSATGRIDGVASCA